jgi:prepilin-type N-terminal cleavage/methylation domain-containing protein
MKNLKKTAGFTLLELSIVLIIVGLLAGGVLAGRHLIQSAKTQNMLGEINQYKTAIRQFREKYRSLPGDMPDAANYWVECVDHGVHNRCYGNDDGSIGAMVGFASNEPFRAWSIWHWQDLSKAHMICQA